MNFEECSIKAVYLATPKVHRDERGEFYRIFCKDAFKQITSSEFVQMNHSMNHTKGTLRGIHYQQPPFLEEKIITCIKGALFDVFVDLRKNSSTFLKWGYVMLSERNRSMLILPKGVAHGFITMEDNTELIYQHSAYYTPNAEAGLRFDDPLINIRWPYPPAVISQRDLSFPLLTSAFKGI